MFQDSFTLLQEKVQNMASYGEIVCVNLEISPTISPGLCRDLARRI